MSATQRRKPYNEVVRGIFDLDVAEVHRRLDEQLDILSKRRDAASVGEVNAAWLRNASDALRLAVRARADYEMQKEDFNQWMEPRRAAALEAINKEQAAGEHKGKRMSDKWITDRVAADHPDDLYTWKRTIRELQAATHQLEGWAVLWRMYGQRIDKAREQADRQGQRDDPPHQTAPKPVRRARARP